MPKSWYIYSENKIDLDNDSQEEIKRKELYKRICAHKKPFFFAYNYPSLKKEYDDYMANVEQKSAAIFKMTYSELKNKQNKSEKEEIFVRRVENSMPLDTSPGVMNRICWKIEQEFDALKDEKREKFDHFMLKSGYNYSKNAYKSIENAYKEYKKMVSNMAKIKKSGYYIGEDTANDEGYDDINQLMECFSEKCHEICPNEYELCDILVDLCYKGRNSKDVVWFVCGETIIENLLRKNNNTMYFPSKVTENEEFWCKGNKFVMKKIKIGGNDE